MSTFCVLDRHQSSPQQKKKSLPRMGEAGGVCQDNSRSKAHLHGVCRAQCWIQCVFCYQQGYREDSQQPFTDHVIKFSAGEEVCG